eukprot:6469087-Amphidinium_carterae.1
MSPLTAAHRKPRLRPAGLGAWTVHHPRASKAVPDFRRCDALCNRSVDAMRALVICSSGAPVSGHALLSGRRHSVAPKLSPSSPYATIASGSLNTLRRSLGDQARDVGYNILMSALACGLWSQP